MKQITPSEAKKIELDILRYVHKICTENNIRYWVCGGTLIGAVRHNGFIPWDDDVDINMPRPDFERFKKIAGSSRYKLLTAENDNYFYAAAKLVDTKTVLSENNFVGEIEELGVYLDIFPLDGLPDNINKAKKEFRKRKIAAGRFRMFYTNGPDMSDGLLKYIYRYIRWIKDKKITGINKLQKKLLELELKYDYDSSELVCSIGGRYKYKEIYPKRFFESVITHKFEDTEVNIPSGYKDFLTQMYGDYMKLPPKEQQVSNHDFTAFWKDEQK